MRVRDFECRSYEAAVHLLGGCTRRKLCHNTYLQRDHVSGGIGIHLHENQIVLFQENKPMRISSCGWKTVTTKQRLNRCLPPHCHLYQVKFDWEVDIIMVEPRTGRMKPVPHRFFDGMEIDDRGNSIG